jgi:hypothetical protein
MTQHQTPSTASDKTNQKPQSNSMLQEVPAPDTTKPAQQPAPQAAKDASTDKAADADTSKSAPATDSASTGNTKA